MYGVEPNFKRLTMAAGATVPRWSYTISDQNNSPSAMPHELLKSTPRLAHTATVRTASHHPMMTTIATSMNTPRQVYPPTVASSIRHTSRCFAEANLDRLKDRDHLHRINNSRPHPFK
jgi:hypothetical protein